MADWTVRELTLPYPPSVNTYWRHVGSKVLVSKGGRQYRDAVLAVVLPLLLRRRTGPLEVEVDLYPPDHRRRDLDNTQKALLDALQHAGVYRDDSQINRLEIRRCVRVVGGKVVVRIYGEDR